MRIHCAAIFEKTMDQDAHIRRPRTLASVKKHNIKLRQEPDHTHTCWDWALMIGGPADEDPILEHPFVSYRFLTMPPIKKAFLSISFMYDEDGNDIYGAVDNPNGVTMHDAFVELTEQHVHILPAYLLAG